MTETAQNIERSPLVVVGRGQIGTPLVHRLSAMGHAVIWVSRGAPGALPEGVRHVSLDVRDGAALAQVARGARALIAAVNPAVYDAKVWAEELPPLHGGLIEGARGAGARLVLLDALYAYTTRRGPLAPTTPEAPETEKGKVRKEMSDMVRGAQREGLRAVVLRAPDFWGPDLANALFSTGTLEGLKAGKRALLLGNPDVPHAFSHRDDVVDALIALALADADVEGRVFHAPVIHETPRAMLEAHARALGVAPRAFVPPRWLLRIIGLFSRNVRGIIEMLPQWEAPYLVDDSAYRARFQASARPLHA